MSLKQFIAQLALLLVVFIGQGWTQSTPAYSVYVETVEAGPGADIPVKFSLSNDQPVSSLTIPITYDPAVLTLMSISFTDSKAQHIANKLITPQDLGSISGHFLVSIFQWLEDPIPAGDGLIFTALFQISATATVGTSSAIDTLFYPPGGELVVVLTDTPGAIRPQFTAGQVVIGENNRRPRFDAIADQYVLEGDSLDFTIVVTDPDNDSLSLSITSKPSGAIFVDNADGTGRLVWVPDYIGPNSADGSPMTLGFWASDGDLSMNREVSVVVLNNNRRPVISAVESITVEAGDQMNISLSAIDPDFEDITWSWSGLPEGAIFDGANPGQIQWQSAITDTGSYEIEFVAIDPQGLSDTILINVTVSAVALYSLALTSVDAFPGEDVSFDLTLDNRLPVAGFNVLFNYDPSAFTLLELTSAGTRSENFEYFTYLNNADGFDGNLRVIGIVDQSGGSSLLPAGEGPIASCTVHTSSELAYSGMSLPLYFQTPPAPTPSEDNTLSDSLGVTIPSDDIVFTSGAIQIQDIGHIRPGDINLNGLAAEIGDVIYFTNHFINPQLYTFNILQYANSDVNQDQVAATVSDLVYLINLVVSGGSFAGKTTGDNSSTAQAEIVLEDHIAATTISYRSDEPLGAAYLVIETDHEIEAGMVRNLATDMTLDYHQDGRELKLLVYSLTGKTLSLGDGELFEIDGLIDFNITKMELSSADGQSVAAALALEAVNLPTAYALEQNYPNPFNPQTQIEFSLPLPSRVELMIYNVLGQQVRELAVGEYPAGQHLVTWDGTDHAGRSCASGVYLYRLVAGPQSFSRKMMLLK